MAVRLLAETGQIGVFEPRFLHPLQQPAQTGGDAVARLMRAVIRIGAKEVVELGRAFGQSLPPVQLSHRELVLVGGEDAAETFLASCHSGHSITQQPPSSRDLRLCNTVGRI